MINPIMLLLAVSLPALADPILYHASERPGVDIAVPSRVWENPYTMCRLSVHDMQPGEWLDIEGFSAVDAVSEWIGLTTWVNVCDPDCKGLDPPDGSSMYSIGNVNRRGEHHKSGRPAAWYVAENYTPEVKLSIVVATYSSKAKHKQLRATAQACGLKVVRYPR